MDIKKELTIIVGLVIFLFLIGFLSTTKDIITGDAGKVGNLYIDLEDDEYLLYVNEAQWIEGKRVELLKVTENEETGDTDVIVSVDGNERSVSDKVIVNEGLQIRKSVAIKETMGKKSFAVLEIIKVEQGGEGECQKTGKICYDDYYKMGVEDFCDGEYLKEYSCEYDEYVNKIHCMKETIKCKEGCSSSRCITRIKAY